MTGVPGPPRARRRVPGGDLAQRGAVMQRAEERGTRPDVRSLLRVATSVILLVTDLLVDPRVPTRTGYERIYDRWRGSTSELAVLLALVGSVEPTRGDCRVA